jgi:hypothetical protein
MAWSIFTQGGGDGAAATWADDLLSQASSAWGVNVDTPGNQQFVYDWEKSEGGGGVDNPLNQGPVPGQPQLTTTGSQYGGGAADFASVDAGLQGALDYLDMPAYSGIKTNLENNQPAAARAALIASPWAASHYGNGANFSTAPLPGQASAITDSSANLTGLNINPLDGFGIPGEIIGSASSGVTGDIMKGGTFLLAIGAGVALVVLGVFKTADPGKSVTQTAGHAAQTAGQTAAMAAMA